MSFKSIFLSALLILGPVFCVSAQDDYNCFTVLAGKNATTDGSVLLGHNEDDGGEQMLNMYIVPADASKGTVRYMWAEFPGQSAADGFMNEYGVCVVSDSCPSKEDVEDYTDGGIYYDLRVDAAKYAKTAREAVELIGQRVEKYGYSSSGRTYIVADPNEGWFISIVRGRHWAARRVADNEVAIIPNYYVVDKVDLSDAENYLGSSDLVEYAIQRGWYNPETDGEFSFRKAYGAPSTFASYRNTERHKAVLNYFNRVEFPYSEDTFPVALTLPYKVNVQNIMDALNNHSEEREDGKHPANVCYETTVLSAVFQLRNDRPLDKGCLMWLAPTKPCVQAYVPWYLGMTKIPEGFSRFDSAEEAQQKHFSDGKDLKVNYPDGAYFKYVDMWNDISEDYSNKIIQRKESKDVFQAKMFKKQSRLDKLVKILPGKWASWLMNRFTAKWVARSLELE